MFENRIKIANSVKSPAFTLQELEATLKNMKIGKSRDPDSLVAEIFKEEANEDNLKLSLYL